MEKFPLSKQLKTKILSDITYAKDIDAKWKKSPLSVFRLVRR